MDSQAPDQPLDQTIRLAAEGDADAWRLLVERYTRRVYGLILRQCGDRDLSEEITQATFVKVVNNLGRRSGGNYVEQGKFEPWLFRIAMNELRDEMRRRKRQARPMDMTPGNGRADGGRTARGESDGSWAASQNHVVGREPTGWDNPFDAVSRQEQIERLRQAIATMSEADQEILYLRHTAGLSFVQIAQTLEQPLGTVLARGHRALGKLRNMLAMGKDT